MHKNWELLLAACETTSTPGDDSRRLDLLLEYLFRKHWKEEYRQIGLETDAAQLRKDHDAVIALLKQRDLFVARCVQNGVDL